MSITEQRHIILQDAVKLASEVATKVPPLWDLPNYVAVNPFLGFSHRPIERAAAEINDALAAELFPPLDYFRQAMARGAFDLSHAREAASRVAIDEQMITSVLAGKQDMPMREVRECPSFMRRHDAAHGTRLEESVLRSIARWCAVYVEAQSTAWAFRADEIGLYRSWREAESADRSLEIAGLRGWRAYVQSLPGHPADALSTALAALPVDADDHHAYLHSLIGALYGWASYFRRQNWQRAEASAGDVLDLLAICASADAGVYELASMPRGSVRVPLGRMVQEEAVRQALQEALEDGYVHTLIAAGVAQPPPRIKTVRPAIQAAFCIDVRSEPLRRHLEAQSDSVQTIGFAGFFGVALSMEDGSAASARCPVLLSPSVSIRPRSGSADANDTIKHLQAAPAAAFSFVELAGWAYGGGLLRSAVAGDSNNVAKECRHGFRFGNSNERTSQAWKADLASGILKNMGLRGELARIVMLCGHEGRSTNNPHAAGLDCGACGGHGGGLNAQVAAELLNDSDVRRALVDRGVTVPPDTIFVPAVHDTSVDEVTFLGANLPAAHEADLATLRQWLTKAAQATRDERSGRLGIKANARRTLLSRLTRRANDWSQVRAGMGLGAQRIFCRRAALPHASPPS